MLLLLLENISCHTYIYILSSKHTLLTNEATHTYMYFKYFIKINSLPHVERKPCLLSLSWFSYMSHNEIIIKLEFGMLVFVEG